MRRPRRKLYNEFDLYHDRFWRLLGTRRVLLRCHINQLFSAIHMIQWSRITYPLILPLGALSCFVPEAIRDRP